MPVGNAPALRAIDERINVKIDEARTNNQQTINLGVFTSVLQYFLKVIGIPLFEAVAGGSLERQQREIAIADLQVRIAEVENKRGGLAEQIREQMVLQVLEFDTIRREFQSG